MGVVGSKSPLERRNTVLRRSQRKSIHGVKSKADKLIKDIKRFKGTEENSNYVDLKARIETAERELRKHAKDLQPQIRHVHGEALKKTEECHKLLSDKLKENQDKLREVQEKEAEKDKKDDQRKEDDDDVFVEELNEEEQKSEDVPDKGRTVELRVIQVASIESSPQINKRFSAMKIGIPVLPGTMMESIHRKTEEMNLKSEERVTSIRKEIAKLEEEISTFVGRKNGKYYNKIRFQLESFANELHTVTTTDDDIQEQIKLCANYINSCMSFLDENSADGVDDDDDFDDVIITNPTKTDVVDSNLSPRSIRTTYI